MYFFFCLDTKEKDTKKKKSRLHFLATPLRNFRGQKELATLKQLFHICVFSSFFGAVRAGRRTLRRVRGQRG